MIATRPTVATGLKIATGLKSEAADEPSHRPLHSPPVESEAARRELVRRIVRSPTFVRSERLGTLLTYVCDMSFHRREAEINEQKIGQAVFGRSPDYDCAVDGIVRSQASRLRQRLDLYFQHEGAGEPVRIVIPRGGYVPLFVPLSAPLPTPLLEAQSASPSAPASGEPVGAYSERRQSPSAQIAFGHKAFRTMQWLPSCVAAVLGLLLAALWIHDRRVPAPAAATAPVTHLLWSHLFAKDQPTIVVAPDSGLVMFHGLSGQDIDLKAYLEAGYRSESNGPPRISPAASRKDWLLDLANRRYTSMVDLKAILSLKDRARTLGSEVSVRYARDLRPNDFKTGTVILLGAASANPWNELFERNMNFVLKDNYTTTLTVLNRSPQQGEPAKWESARNDPQRRVFGVIAYMPALAGNGNALLLEGTSMSGTEAATDFVADDAQLLPFLKRIQRPDGTLPHFELLLGTQNMGSSATQSHILAWRTMN